MSPHLAQTRFQAPSCQFVVVRHFFKCNPKRLVKSYATQNKAKCYRLSNFHNCRLPSESFDGTNFVRNLDKQPFGGEMIPLENLYNLTKAFPIKKQIHNFQHQGENFQLVQMSEKLFLDVLSNF
jgi:hypothetical protein